MSNLKFYVVEHASGSDVLREYEGMTQAAIEALFAESGNTIDFIEKDDFEARMAVAENARPKPTPENMRQAAYAAESDALVIRAVRLQMAGDTGFDAAKSDALAKVAEIKARYPDKGV